MSDTYESTAELEVAEITAPVELHTRVRVTVAAKTDMGRVRENNEDKHEFFLPEDDVSLARRGMAFVVCDGMGGHEAGQIASELAVKTFLDVYYGHPADDPELAAVNAVAAANRFIMDQARAVPARHGMGTTLTALLLLQDQALIMNVGDSRCYRMRSQELIQITEDHTWVEETVKSGVMTREQAEAHPYRHMIMRALGTPDSRSDCFWHPVQIGDTFLLCSDGVTNHVDDAKIAEVLGARSPSLAAWELVSSALVGGGSDNATVIVVRIDALDPVDAGR